MSMVKVWWKKFPRNSKTPKITLIIRLLAVGLLIIFVYQSFVWRHLILSKYMSLTAIFTQDQFQGKNQSFDNILNMTLTFERRTHCNYNKKEMCYSTNKSLVVTFWQNRSKDKWVSQNILSAFPLHSFDHIIFIHDDSTWNTHPGYKHFIWIHVNGQLRFWYVKRFISPSLLKSYKFLWIIDDDAQLTFNPLHYQCVVGNLSIPLSAPGRLSGALSHSLTQVDNAFSNRIGRWTDFVETGPVVIASSLAWQCIYMHLDASAGSGWGIDLIWCNIIAQRCLPSSEQKKACAILDVFGVHHQSPGVNSNGDGSPELSLYTNTYRNWIATKKNIASLAKTNSLVDFCSK